jgi:hypothetical protein
MTEIKITINNEGEFCGDCHLQSHEAYYGRNSVFCEAFRDYLVRNYKTPQETVKIERLDKCKEVSTREAK